jgi:hypothetical protein
MLRGTVYTEYTSQGATHRVREVLEIRTSDRLVFEQSALTICAARGLGDTTAAVSFGPIGKPWRPARSLPADRELF